MNSPMNSTNWCVQVSWTSPCKDTNSPTKKSFVLMFCASLYGTKATKWYAQISKRSPAKEKNALFSYAGMEFKLVFQVWNVDVKCKKWAVRTEVWHGKCECERWNLKVSCESYRVCNKRCQVHKRRVWYKAWCGKCGVCEVRGEVCDWGVRCEVVVNEVWRRMCDMSSVRCGREVESTKWQKSTSQLTRM